METTKMTDILANVRYSSDIDGFDGSVKSWKTLLKVKLSDFWVPALIREIQAKGFKVPIHLDKYTPGSWDLGNGHHRLAVAILLGLDEVPTTENWDESMMFDRDSVQRLAQSDDSDGADKLANSIEYAIDWDNWPEPA
jgi:hypothetical protein